MSRPGETRIEKLERLAAMVRAALINSEEFDGRGNACGVGSAIYRDLDEIAAIVGYRKFSAEARNGWRWQEREIVKSGRACAIADKPRASVGHVAGALATGLLAENVRNGGTVEIPSLGITLGKADLG